MKDMRVERLNKKITADMVCCMVIATAMGFLTIVNLWYYFSCDGRYLETLESAIRSIVICVAFVVVSLIMIDIKRKSKPFAKGIITKLIMLAVWVMVGAFLPDIICLFVEFVRVEEAVFVFDIENFFVLLLGMLIGIISEIFRYGYELQEDVDSIA